MATGDAPDFPVTWNGDYPTQIDLEGYRLRVEGDVSTPLEFTIEELRAMPTVSGWSTINCVEGWSAPVQWEGIPLSRLLNLARAPKNTDYVRVEGVTGYVARIRRSEVEDPATMIALKAGGIPLTVEHGYPARLVVSTRPGLDWVKYVSRIRPGV
jgi:DMSO/TMAO reductase YedYZ molybdopterin-dependent catalytic subunit